MGSKQTNVQVKWWTTCAVLLCGLLPVVHAHAQLPHSTMADTAGMARDLRIIERKLGPLDAGIRDHMAVVEVQYYSFVDSAGIVVDKRNLRSGILLVHACVAEDVKAIFEGLRLDTFPIAKVIPVNRYGLNADSTGWNDAASMADNNTSAFNYRRKPTSKSPSKHGQGIAIDINPLFNPYVRKEGKVNVYKPKGGRYEPKRRGTLTLANVMKHLERRGWSWGGRWANPKDYQHIEKTRGLCKHLPMRIRGSGRSLHGPMRDRPLGMV
jgi:hypothetical protein